ncbi:MAG: UDP-N-acetylmuramoyl-tripeptide--D-alanyl-D-alanine ligase [Candidatus Acetothermia bacterium]
MLSLSRFPQATGGQFFNRTPTRLTGVSIDSRTLKKGNFFVALKGNTTDGHRYLEEVFQKGASGAMISDRDHLKEDFPNLLLVPDTEQGLLDLAAHYRSDIDSPLVAVTGSWGKTTTKELITYLLNCRSSAYGSPGNYNTEYGLPLSLLHMPEDSNFGVFELGTRFPGDIPRLSNILSPTLAVITGIGKVHLEQFEDHSALVKEKLGITSGMSEGSSILVNGEGDILRDSSITAHNRLFFGQANESASHLDYIGDHVRLKGLDGSSFRFREGSRSRHFELRLLGRANVTNAVAALGTVRELEQPLNQLPPRLDLPPLDHRLDPIQTSFGTILDDSYNSNPTAAKVALDLLGQCNPRGRKVAVLGDMLELGEGREDAHRQLVPHLTSANVDVVYTFGSLASVIHREIQNRDLESILSQSFQDRGELVKQLKSDLRGKYNLVLIKGSRSLRMEKIVGELIAK